MSRLVFAKLITPYLGLCPAAMDALWGKFYLRKASKMSIF